MPTFPDARLKIQRANKHIADANEWIRVITSPESQTSWLEVNPCTRQQVIHYRLNKLSDLPGVALIVGDAIHNLKTALDYGWNRIVANFAAGRITKFSKFPVYPSVNELEAVLRSNGIHAVNPDLFALMLSDVKPCSGGDDFLWAIHKYDISDKHRLLIPTTELWER